MEIYRTGSLRRRPGTADLDDPEPDGRLPAGLRLAEQHRPARLLQLVTSATLTTTSSWKTGVYLIRLVRSNNTDFHVLLTVRNDSAAADVLYVVPDTDLPGLQQLRRQVALRLELHGRQHARGRRPGREGLVRPPLQRRSARQQHDWYTTDDLRTVSWLESQGYNVGYVTDTDLDRDPSLLSGQTAVILGGHDEYYSTGMRDALDRRAQRRARRSSSAAPTRSTGRSASRPARPPGHPAACRCLQDRRVRPPPTRAAPHQHLA